MNKKLINLVGVLLAVYLLVLIVPKFWPEKRCHKQTYQEYSETYRQNVARQSDLQRQITDHIGASSPKSRTQWLSECNRNVFDK